MRALRKFLLRLALGLLGLLALTAAVFIVLGWSAFGAGAKGERKARIERSKQWDGHKFENPQPLWNDVWGSVSGFLEMSPVATPQSGEVPVERGDEARFATPPPSGLRVTWFGHSTTLIEVDGLVLLTDPVWSDRASPYSFVGPSRWYPPLVALDKLPHIDAVLISHDHYDHLDEGTVRALEGKRFFVPLGVGAHLEYWGIPPADITELDWWEEANVGALRIVSTPSRHASGRQVLDQGATLWTSWSVIGPTHRVFYSGDTGLHPAMRDIGDKLGPFDVALIEVGQYNRAWPDWHIGPEQAVKAVGWLKGRVMFPIHWGLFTLALHGWTEPIERATAAAALAQQPIVTPKPGQSVEPTEPWAAQRWWPERAWQTAQQHTITSTKVE